MPAAKFIGMDEAGYGPNLGPLVIVATVWKTPGPPAACPFYDLLSGVVSRDSHEHGGKLHIADSKQVYSSQTGIDSLERSALALLRTAGRPCAGFRDLVCALQTVPPNNGGCGPWYAGVDLKLPFVADAGQIEELSAKLERELSSRDLSLTDIRAAVVEPKQFNTGLRECANKAELLSRTALRLLRQVWNPSDEVDTHVVGDKHGGRNRYDGLLAEILDGEMIFRLMERRSLSRYRVNTTELTFQTRGERHLPVAAASIVAKYVREAAMELFNRYWLRQVPGLRPTKGYPTDARRFRDDVQAKLPDLGIDEESFWRNR